MQPVVHLESNDSSTRELSGLVGARMQLAPRWFAALATGVTYWQDRYYAGTIIESAIGVPLSLAAGVDVTPALGVELAAFSPELFRGGINQFERGAHDGPMTIGVLVSPSYRFAGGR